MDHSDLVYWEYCLIREYRSFYWWAHTETREHCEFIQTITEKILPWPLTDSDSHLVTKTHIFYSVFCSRALRQGSRIYVQLLYLFLLFQASRVERATAQTVVTEGGDPAVFPVHPASPGPPVPPVWTVTASRHSASCPWWRRRSLRRTPAWRAPVRCEEGPEWKTRLERLEEEPWKIGPVGFCHFLFCFFIWSAHWECFVL